MRKNVIILTHGWTGSSVFTALIARAGYWTGNSTFEKRDYDTYENSKLIELNRKMLIDLGYTGDHEHEFDPKVVSDLALRASDIDLSPYCEFIDSCNENQPWIWKDPRLTWTIRVWANLMQLDNVAFVILTRDDEQAWISSNLRKHIQSQQFTRRYNKGITDSLKQFLVSRDQKFLEFEFEDLLIEPKMTIDKLNDFLDTSLLMDDLHAVCKQPLYRKSKGFSDKIKAAAIYFKNYSERYR